MLRADGLQLLTSCLLHRRILRRLRLRPSSAIAAPDRFRPEPPPLPPKAQLLEQIDQLRQQIQGNLEQQTGKSKEIDWRVATAPAAAAAFAQGAGTPRYDTPWTPDGIPRRTLSPGQP